MPHPPTGGKAGRRRNRGANKMSQGTDTDRSARTPQYGMKVEKGITVRMRDGVRISLCVYRPDAPGRFPALFAASPYQYEMDEVPAYPLFLWRETGPVEWYVGQGYAYVHADVRGSGQSEGEFSFMGREEQHDYVELIAWIVQQGWCNGRVGGIGQSYYAMAQWLMATMNPPGLACIVPYDGLVDQYRCSNYHGGIFCSYRSVWYTSLRADNQHRLAGKQGRAPMRFDLVGAITEHTLDDEFWRERSPYWRLKDIRVPVLSIGHWGKMGLHLRGNILGYEELTCPKKLVVTGARNTFEAHKMFDQVEFHETECLPFYDLHLKGSNNSFMDASPVRLFVRGANVWRSQEEWPPKRATYTPYYLRKGPSGSVTSLNDGGLSADQPGADEAATSYTYPDWEWVNGVVVTGPDGRPDFTKRRADLHLRAAGGRPRGHRPDRAQAVRLVERDRHPVHRQARRPASAGRGGARQGRATGVHPGVEGLAQGLAPREGRGALDPDAAVLHPHQSAADRAGRDLPVRHRGAAGFLRVQAGPPHPARARQRRFTGDRRGVLASLSPEPDGQRHHPSRRRPCIVPLVAGGWIIAVQSIKRTACHPNAQGGQR